MDAERQRIEWLKCKRSVLYFIVEYVTIYDATTSEWIDFNLWSSQRSALVTFASSAKVLVLKARQLGLSWLVLAYCLHVMLFKPRSRVLLFSMREDEAFELLRRVRFMYGQLPAWMQARSIEVDNSGHFAISTGSSAMAFSTGGGRSYTGTVAVIDEADFVRGLARFLNAVKPTVDAGGQLFLISTSDKSRPLSTFKNLFRAAMEGIGDYVSVFLPWSAHPVRDQAWYERVAAEMYAQRRTHDDMHAEYPESIEQALAPEELDRRVPWSMVKEVYRESGNVDAADLPALPGLVITRRPDPDRSYVIGCDPAEGNLRSDESAAVVLDAQEWVQVAVLGGRWEVGTFAAYIDALAVFYNGADLMVERNNHGHALLLALQDSGRSRLLDGYDGRPGFLSSVKGKRLLYDTLAQVVKDQDCGLTDRVTAMQVASVQASDLRAPEGLEDDRADAFALAIWACANSDINVQTAAVVAAGDPLDDYDETGF